MQKTTTESMHEHALGLDLEEPARILSALMEGQTDAAACVHSASDAIIKASKTAAATIRAGGRLIYAAAGSSGLMALSDALELPGTFGIDRDQIRVLFAGGPPWLDTFRGGPEDDAGLAIDDIMECRLTDSDCLIAVSASGSTPYAVAALQKAVEIGAATVAIANNSGSPLLVAADTAIFLPTPAELIAGSTRMGAGTAQKIALNLISTLMAIDLGHVVDGHMVNLIVDNAKLRSRAANIIAVLAKCSEDTALACLDQAGGSVKAAILLASGAADPDAAQRLLESNNGNVRSAMAALNQGFGSEQQRA
ncbi:N-acetylmuramic acid 6-phosphate etherase [Hoeflea sp. TYP-13]|uniref:N-acetylmuramic acid 6-phosphate etherase n=1 Tax=Hoeflea sp. TYP-13 TaxID=3230023 RepID=UPI0034C5E13C